MDVTHEKTWVKKIIICKIHFWSMSENITKKGLQRQPSPLEPLKTRFLMSGECKCLAILGCCYKSFASLSLTLSNWWTLPDAISPKILYGS